MSHSTLGILDVPLITGNDVNMDVENTLSGRWPDVNADIVAIRVNSHPGCASFLIYQVHTGRYLILGQLEKAGHMAMRNDQRMARAHPIGITSTVGKFTFLGRRPLWIFTKQTGVIGVTLFCWFLFRPTKLQHPFSRQR